MVTLRYRDGLRRQARSQLLAGARAIRLLSDGSQLKALVASLALDPPAGVVSSQSSSS